MNSYSETINDLFVNIFNYILIAEEKWLKEQQVNLTINEVHVIEKIGTMRLKSLGEVAEKLYVTSGTLTVMVNKLVSKNYIDKLRSDKDKRVVYLNLTKKGEDIFESHKNFHEKMIKDTQITLDKNERDSLVNALINISKFFKTTIE